jgi:hypothetical protein
VIRSIRLLAPLLLALAAACGRDATGPAHPELVGTWASAPEAVRLAPAGDAFVRQYTLTIDPSGAFVWEGATYGARAYQPLSYSKTIGTLHREKTGVHFHPTGAVQWNRTDLAQLTLRRQPVADQPYRFQVAGGRLLLREPGSGAPIVFHRAGAPPR